MRLSRAVKKLSSLSICVAGFVLLADVSSAEAVSRGLNKLGASSARKGSFVTDNFPNSFKGLVSVKTVFSEFGVSPFAPHHVGRRGGTDEKVSLLSLKYEDSPEMSHRLQVVVSDTERGRVEDLSKLEPVFGYEPAATNGDTLGRSVADTAALTRAQEKGRGVYPNDSVRPAVNITTADEARASVLARMTRGVNTSLVFQYGQELKALRPEDWRELRRLGFDHIRLPVDPRTLNWEPNAIGAPDLRRLEKIVRDAIDAGLVVVLDGHLTPDDPLREGLARGNKDAELAWMAWWKRIATQFAAISSEYLVFEPLNEPLMATERWAPIQVRLLRVLRATQPTRVLVASAGAWSGVQETLRLDVKPLRKIGGVILTTHFYDPFVFTHQGAPWTNTPAVYVRGLGFPNYPGQGWVERGPTEQVAKARDWMVDYQNRDVRAEMRQSLDRLVDLRKSSGLPVWIGETGAMMQFSAPNATWDYLTWMSEETAKRQIPVTFWDLASPEFGLFDYLPLDRCGAGITCLSVRSPVGWTRLRHSWTP